MRGHEELHRGIAIMFAVARQRGLQITKELIAATADTIVNAWRGTLGSEQHARGVEIWQFDNAGVVVQHRMFTSLDVHSDREILQRLRALLLYPRTALAFFRAQQANR